jgi:rubrerythrin
MKEEEEAMQMYQALANSSTSPDQKEMFLALAGMERSHKVKSLLQNSFFEKNGEYFPTSTLFLGLY